MGKKTKQQTVEDSSPGVGHTVIDNVTHMDSQREEVSVTPGKGHKKHKKSKKGDQDVDDPPTQDPSPAEEQDTGTERKKKKEKRKAAEEDVAEEVLKPPKVKKHKLGDETDIAEESSRLEPVMDCSTETRTVEAICSEHSIKEKKKKKKKKKVEEANSEVLSTTDSVSHVSGTEGPPAETNTDGVHAESSQAKKKKKKDKRKSKQDEDGISRSDASLDTDPKDAATDCSSEKQKGKSEYLEAAMIADNSAEKVTAGVTPKKKKEKKRKSEQIEEATVARNGAEIVTNGSTPKKKEKKRKSDQAEEATAAVNSAEMETDSFSPKKKKEKKRKSENTEEITVPISSAETGTNDATPKKKKEKKRKSESTEAAAAAVNGAETVTNSCTLEENIEEKHKKKKSKKQKKAEIAQENGSEIETGDSATQGGVSSPKQKKKKKSKEKEENPEQPLRDTDQGAGSENTNNDNDTANHKLKHHTTNNQTPTDPGKTHGDPEQTNSASVGQWSTNMFGNSERQNKFLRLLGGFKKAENGSPAMSGPKKGLFGSLKLQGDSNTGGQRALTYQAAQEMNSRLESDYERALTFSARGQRGVGLGFKADPAEGKKFHIDVNKVASKSFD